MDRLKKTSTLITLFSIAFLALVIVNPGEGYSDFLVLFSASAAVIFGIFIVFSVSNSRERLNKTNELLKTEDANSLLVYRLSKVFGTEVQDKIRELIDKYFISQIDYKLEDFDKSDREFCELLEYVVNLECKGKKQECAHTEMMAVLTTSSTNRIQVETIVLQKLSKFEWLSVLGLASVIVSQLYEMSHEGGGILQAILITVLAASCVLLVLVLRDLDSLKWQKDMWTWRPLRNFFISLDLLPYYPKPAVDAHEVTLTVGDKFRLATYLNPYPDVAAKTIEVVAFDGKGYAPVFTEGPKEKE